MADKAINTSVNQFPTLTWNHLNINRTDFNQTISSVAEPSVVLADGVCAEKIPVDRYSSVECGMGPDFGHELDEFIQGTGTDSTDLFTVNANAKASNTTLSFVANEGTKSFSDVVIHAEEGSESTFIFVYRSTSDANAVFGSRIRVIADEYAVVHLVTVNLLGSNVVYFNDIGSKLADSAKLEHTQVEVGGKNNYSGSFNVLDGYKSSFVGHYGYISNQGRTLDINQVVRHFGRESESKFTVDGVVDHNSHKTWRGTIDFKKGCVDAKGDEQEDVLLLVPCVVNKSLPVILCDEEAVEGRHGCSIGRIETESLFYMQSRGVDQVTAEFLLIMAKIASVCKFIPDETLVQEIIDFTEGTVKK